MLSRIPFRLIRRNMAQFSGIILLVLLATMFYSVMAITIKNVEENYLTFKNKYNQEDAHLVTVKEIDQNTYRDFGFILEERPSFDYNYDGKTLRLFALTHRVNIPYVIEGRLPHVGEIMIDPLFAKRNNIKIGDEFKIGSYYYRVSGFFSLPDYTYIIKNDYDIINNPNIFGIAILNKEDLKNHFNPNYHYYMLKNIGTMDFDYFKENISKNYGLLDFKKASENPRIYLSETKIKGVREMNLPLTIFMVLISTSLLFIILKRIIYSMYNEIGTLFALGYAKEEIRNIFIKLSFIIWGLGSIPGVFLGFLLSIPFTKFYVEFFNIPLIKIGIPYYEMFIALLIPAIFLIPSAYVSTRTILSKKVVDILKGTFGKVSKRGIGFRLFDNLPFVRRIMFKQWLQNLSRHLIFIVGIGFATVLLIYGLVAQSSLNYIVKDTYENVFKYNYIYLLNSLQTENNFGGEEFNILNFSVNSENINIPICGIKKNSNIVNLKDNTGKKIDVKGLVITKPLAQKLGLKKGDKITVINKIDNKEYTLTIENIADLYIGNQGYMEIGEFNRTFGFPDNAYIGLFSQKELSIPQSLIYTVQDRDYTIKAFEDISKPIKTSITVMAVFALIMAFAIIYVITSLIISENRRNISLFKILGFTEKEISHMIFGLNIFSFVIGFLIGIPLFYVSINSLINSITKNVDFTISLKVNYGSLFAAFIILYTAYYLVTYLSNRAVNLISPVVILNEQRE